MKLKYKKAVLLISMGSMFIGLMAFSIGVNSSAPANKVKSQQTATPPAQTETPDTAYTLNKSEDEKINELVQAYFKASVEQDMDGLEELVTNIDYVNESQLKVKYEYVEDVKNIECYKMEGPEEGSYLVYVYSELKIKDIDTLAPGLSRFYIITGEEGKMRVFFGADSTVEAFIEEADVSEEVQELAGKVQTRLEEALSSDTKLMEFNKKLTQNAAASKDESGEDKKEAGEQE